MGKKVIIFTWIIALILLPTFFWYISIPPPADTTEPPTYTSWSYDWSVGIAAISDNGQFIVAGDEDNNIYLFDRSNSTPLWTYTGALYDISSVDISSNGDFLVAASGNRVYLFNRTSKRIRQYFQTIH